VLQNWARSGLVVNLLGDTAVPRRGVCASCLITFQPPPSLHNSFYIPRHGHVNGTPCGPEQAKRSPTLQPRRVIGLRDQGFQEADRQGPTTALTFECTSYYHFHERLISELCHLLHRLYASRAYTTHGSGDVRMPHVLPLQFKKCDNVTPVSNT